MFSSSRQGGFIYVLSKGERPTVKIGQIESVSSPVPKYPTYNPSVPYSPQPEMLIDIKVRCGEEVLDFQKLPANGEMFAYPNVIVSEKKEAIISEVEAMMQTSKQIVESVSYHNSVIESCDSILKELNPQFAKEKQHEDRINSLELEVKSVKDGLGDIKSLLIEMNTSNKPKTTNSK